MIRLRDRERVRLLLHPYVRWTDTSGATVRGGNAVMSHVRDVPPRWRAAKRYELRRRSDLQVARGLVVELIGRSALPTRPLGDAVSEHPQEPPHRQELAAAPLLLPLA